jgi:hypothetical protein
MILVERAVAAEAAPPSLSNRSDCSQEPTSRAGAAKSIHRRGAHLVANIPAQRAATQNRPSMGRSLSGMSRESIIFFWCLRTKVEAIRFPLGISPRNWNAEGVCARLHSATLTLAVSVWPAPDTDHRLTPTASASPHPGCRNWHRHSARRRSHPARPAASAPMPPGPHPA